VNLYIDTQCERLAEVVPDADALDLDAAWCIWPDPPAGLRELGGLVSGLDLEWACWRARAYVPDAAAPHGQVGVVQEILASTAPRRVNHRLASHPEVASLSDPAIEIAAGLLTTQHVADLGELLNRQMAAVHTSLALVSTEHLDSWLLLDSIYYRYACRSSAPATRTSGTELLLEYLKVAASVVGCVPTLFLRHDQAALVFFLGHGDESGLRRALAAHAASVDIGHVNALVARGISVPLLLQQ
jgi:hypothetical protein